MPRSLRQIARALDHVQVRVTRLQADLALLIAAEARPQPPAAPRQRPSRWTGPVPDTERDRRREVWAKRYLLALELGLNPSKLRFAMDRRLGHPSTLSHWLTGGLRCIKPGSVLDKRIWDAVNADNAKFEALKAKRHGNSRLPIFQKQVSATM